MRVVVKDPVCFMEVDATEYKIEFNGKTYYFCSERCMNLFKLNPVKYSSRFDFEVYDNPCSRCNLCRW